MESIQGCTFLVDVASASTVFGPTFEIISGGISEPIEDSISQAKQILACVMLESAARVDGVKLINPVRVLGCTAHMMTLIGLRRNATPES
jgi:hypothetical protein